MSKDASCEKKIKGYLPPAVDAVLDAVPVEKTISRRDFVAGAAGVLGALVLGSKLQWFESKRACAVSVADKCNFGTKSMIVYWWGNSDRYEGGTADCFDMLSNDYYKAMDADNIVFMANVDSPDHKKSCTILTSSSSYGGTTIQLASRNMTYRSYGWDWATNNEVTYYEAGSGPYLALRGMSCNRKQTTTYSGGNLAFKINNAMIGFNTATKQLIYYDMRVVITNIDTHVCGPNVLFASKPGWGTNTDLYSSDWVAFLQESHIDIMSFADLFEGGLQIRPQFDVNQAGGRYLNASLSLGLSITWHVHTDGASVGSQLVKGRIPFMVNGVIEYADDDGYKCEASQYFNLLSPTELMHISPNSTVKKGYAGYPPSIEGSWSLHGAGGGVNTLMGTTKWGQPIYWSSIYSDAHGLAGGFSALHNLSSSSSMSMKLRTFTSWPIYFCFAGHLNSAVLPLNMGEYTLYTKGLGAMETFSNTPFFNETSFGAVVGNGTDNNPINEIRFLYPWGHSIQYAIKPGAEVDAIKYEVFDRAPTYREKSLDAWIPFVDFGKNPTEKSEIKWADEFETVTMPDGEEAILIGTTPANACRDIRIIGVPAVKIHVYTDVPAQISIDLVSGEMRDLDETKEVDGKGVEQWTYVGKRLLKGGTVKITVSINKQHCYWDTLERTSPPGANSQVTKFTENTQIQYHTEANMEQDVKLYYTTRPIYHQPNKNATWTH